jgi:stearoyl-CoA desaturase (delta-9 desaturase)
MVILFSFIGLWYTSLFSQSFFHHRYASHRAFTMSRFWERVFHVFSYIAQGPSFLSPRAYAVVHRMHHAYADTEKDPHSPKYHANVFAMMWHTRRVYLDIAEGLVHPGDQFMKNLPQWRGFDKFAGSYFSRIGWVGIYVTLFILFAPSLWIWSLLPIMILITPIQGAIVNWFAHKYGFVNFKLRNTSRNLLPVDVLLLGEAYHNDHHHAPARANFGARWFQVDPVYYIILFFHKLRIIRLRQPRLRLAFRAQRSEPETDSAASVTN